MGNSSKKTIPVLIALFAALVSAGCFIQIPLPGGVPIVVQDMMAIIAGLLLGPLYGGFSILLFLVLGSIGLPVFSGKAGIHVIFQGPTGGFLIGYLIASIVGGLILKLALRKPQTVNKTVATSVDKSDVSRVKHDDKQSQLSEWIWITVAVVVSTAVVFLFGCLGFARVTESGLAKTVAVVLLPFIPGNIIKILVIIPIVKKFRPIVKNYRER